MSGIGWGRACPCGTARPLDTCCGPLIANRRPATTPEELMRSRYTAYAVGDRDPALPGPAHLFRTWHPRTRPTDVSPDPDVEWTGLEVLDAPDAGPEATTGEVEFAAHFRRRGVPGTLRERSRFVRRAGRWVYLDGDVGADVGSDPGRRR